MKKIHLKQKSLGISSIVLITLFLFFSSGPLAHADLPDPDYYIGYFEIQTRTFAGSDPETYFWFTIRDANYHHARHVESVVESATITYPDRTNKSFIPVLTAWSHSERRGSDNNRNGIIDIQLEEYEFRVNSGVEYEVISPVSPHVAGTYELNVTCNNGQTIYASYSTCVDCGGMTATDLPPVTNVEASFNDDGLFQVSWDLPTVVYPSDNTIQIRVERYEKDKGRRYARYRVQNLPADQTSYTFFKWESDVIRLFTPYIDVKVRTYMPDRDSMAQSEVKEYKIKKILKNLE